MNGSVAERQWTMRFRIICYRQEAEGILEYSSNLRPAPRAKHQVLKFLKYGKFQSGSYFRLIWKTLVSCQVQYRIGRAAHMV